MEKNGPDRRLQKTWQTGIQDCRPAIPATVSSRISEGCAQRSQEGTEGYKRKQVNPFNRQIRLNTQQQRKTNAVKILFYATR